MNEIKEGVMKMKKITKKISMLMVLLVAVIVTVGLRNTMADEPLNAKKFDFSGSYSADQWITETDSDGVWYKLEVPSDGIIEIRIMSYCSGTLRYSLHSEDLAEQYKFTSCDDYISGGDDSSPVTGAVTKALSKGTYYFCLSGAVGRYRVMGKFESYKSNDFGADSYDSPFKYSMKSTVTGALTTTDTEDWYKIVIPKSGKYKLKISSYCDDSLYYTLFNSDLSQKISEESIYGGSASQPAAKEYEYVLGAGTYYLKVTGDYGKYTFSFKGKEVLKNAKLSVKIKNRKTIIVKTIKNANVTIKYSKGKKKMTSGSLGKISLKLKKKLKKGSKVVVTVKKKGYQTKKMTKKVK